MEYVSEELHFARIEDSAGANQPSESQTDDIDSSQQSFIGSFYVDWNHPSVGCVGKDGKKGSGKSDFAIKLDMMIEARQDTGYLATVKRAIDGEQRSCFFTIESTSYKPRFMTQINNSFGSGGMSLALNEAQFQHFILYLKDNVSSLPIREAISLIGLNDKHSVWVLSEHLQINADGQPLSEEEYKLIWHESSIKENLRSTRVQLDEVIPRIITPFQTSTLSRVVYLLQTVMKHNFFSSLIVVSGMILAFHYSTLTTSSFGCPLVVAHGPPETGKSKTLTTALALVGLGRHSIYESFTNAFVMERASVSTMPFAIDDLSKTPVKGSDINEVVVDIYNHGKTGTLRKSSYIPSSAPLIATNYCLKNDVRVRSRVCIAPFKSPAVTPSDEEEHAQDAFDDLDDILMEGSLSAACGWVIKVGQSLHDRQTVREMAARFRPHFPGRQVINWALLGVCVKELLSITDNVDIIDDVLEFMTALGDEVREQALLQSPSVASDDKSIVHTTIHDILSDLTEKSLPEILNFMRADLSVASRPVLSVVLSDILSSLTHSLAEIRGALMAGRFGLKNVSKDFLTPGSSDTTISRNVNSKRRKCEVIFLDMLDPQLTEQIRANFANGGSGVEASADGRIDDGLIAEGGSGNRASTGSGVEATEDGVSGDGGSDNELKGGTTDARNADGEGSNGAGGDEWSYVGANIGIDGMSVVEASADGQSGDGAVGSGESDVGTSDNGRSDNGASDDGGPMLKKKHGRKRARQLLHDDLSSVLEVSKANRIRKKRGHYF